MKRVVIESPYAGNVAANVAYAKRCVLDCLRRGESAYASHLFFTQSGLLNDDDPHQRVLGIAAGLVWGGAAELVAVYVDRGLSRGMLQGIAEHRRSGRLLVCRRLDGPGAPCDVDLDCLCTCCSAGTPPAGCVLHDPNLNPTPEEHAPDAVSPAGYVVRDADGQYVGEIYFDDRGSLCINEASRIESAYVFDERAVADMIGAYWHAEVVPRTGT